MGEEPLRRSPHRPWSNLFHWFSWVPLALALAIGFIEPVQDLSLRKPFHLMFLGLYVFFPLAGIAGVIYAVRRAQPWGIHLLNLLLNGVLLVWFWNSTQYVFFLRDLN